MVFVAIGLLVGPEVLDEIDLSSSSSAVRVLAEATLALVLFCDASRIDLKRLRDEVGVPAPTGRRARSMDRASSRHSWRAWCFARRSGVTPRT
jgi:hypothetical protein